MPDITMCSNRECPLRSGCYRYRAVPNGDWQSYSGFNHRIAGDTGCQYFVNLREGDVLRSFDKADKTNGGRE